MTRARAGRRALLRWTSALALPAALRLERSGHARHRGGDPRTRPPARVEVEALELSALRARLRAREPVLLHLWATWCPPCLEELPRLAELAPRWRARGVTVLSVCLDPPGARAREAIARALRRRGPGLSPLWLRLDDTDAAADALIEAVDPAWDGSIPALFGYAPGGRLAGALFGLPAPTELDELVQALLTARVAD